MILYMKYQITRFRSKSLAQEGRMEKALHEHKQLLAAIKEGDSERARRLAQQHIESARNSIVSVFEKHHME